MTHQRPFRFGAAVFTAPSREAWIALAHKVMDLGYTTLSIPDHFQEQLAPFTALMTVADALPTLRIGSYVFANDFRHPALLAKEAATLDLLSGGRFEFGIGAGWSEPDYTRTGMLFDRPGIRVSRLAEAVPMIKRLFGDDPVTFTGAHYIIKDLVGYPKPLQQPHPPIMIGGNGKRMLSLAGREADIVSLINDLSGSQLHFEESSLAAMTQRVAWVRAAAGERFDRLEFNTLIWDVMVTNDQQQGAEQLASKWNLTSAQVLDSIHFLVGTLEQISATSQARREQLGLSYLTVAVWAMEQLAPVVARLTGT